MPISHSWRWICPHYECWSIGIMFDYTGTCCCLLRWCWFLHVLDTRRIIENGQKKSEYLLSAGECLTTCFLHRQRKMRPNENHCGRAHIVWTPNVLICIFYSRQRICIFLQQFRYILLFFANRPEKNIFNNPNGRNEWMSAAAEREREREQKNHSRIRVFDPIYDAIRLRCVYIFFLFSPLQFSQSLIHSTARLLFIRSIVRLCAWLFLSIFMFD